MMKNINSAHIAQVKSELGDSAKFIDSARDHWADIPNTTWLRVYLPDEDRYIKMISKEPSADEQQQTENLQHINLSAGDNKFHDVMEYIIDHQLEFKDLLPAYIKQTTNFYCFEWLGGEWETPTRHDFMNTDVYNNKISEIANLVNGASSEGELKLTDFTKQVFTRFNKLYRDTTVGKLPSESVDIYGQIPDIAELNRLCIAPTNINLYDFVVRRDAWGRIIDWKYVDIKNLDYTFPRYFMTIDEKCKYPCDNPAMQHNVNDNYIGHDVLNNSELIELYATGGFKTYISDGVEWHAGDILNDL